MMSPREEALVRAARDYVATLHEADCSSPGGMAQVANRLQRLQSALAHYSGPQDDMGRAHAESMGVSP